MLKRSGLLAAMIFLFSVAALAQSHDGIVKGFVYDKKNGEPMIYTNVIFKGTSYGVQTDVNGYFSISLPAGSYTMITTNIGYDSASAFINLLADQVITKKLFISQKETTLKNVEISARKTEKITHIDAGKTTISPREIKLLPSAGGEPDVAQALQVVPGVVFTGDQGGQLYIRGGSPTQTGILLDGVTIYNPFHSIGLFSVFETDAIRNVDVYSAGFDAEYGNRTSAIVDVHTKDGNKNNLAGIVSVSPIMSRALLEGPIVKSKSHNGSGITFLVTAKTSYLDKTSKSLYSGLGQPFSYGLPYNFTDMYGKVTFNADNGSKLNVFGFNFKDNASLLDPMSDHEIQATYGWQATGGGATFVVSPSNSSALIDGKFAYSKYTINMNEAAQPQPRNSGINGFESAINFSYFLPHYSELKYGIEVSGYHTNLDYYVSPDATTTLDQQSTLAGLYIKYRKDFNDKLIFEPSLRVQYYSDQSKISPEPRVGLKYNISRNVRLKAAAGLYSQDIMSTKSDLDIVNLFSGFILSPDEQIRNNNGENVNYNLQTAYHVLGGIEVDINRVELNLEPWLKDFTQLIEINRDKLYATDPDFVAGTGKGYGVDLSAKYVYRRLYLYGVFSYQNITYTSVDGQGNIQTYPPPFDRRINVNLVGSYDAGKRRDWEFSLRFNMGSPFPFTQTQGFYEQPNVTTSINNSYLTANGLIGILYANEINGGRLSYYHRLDASIRKRFFLSKNSNIDATFSVVNVYDRQNIFYINRTTNSRVYQLPLFPSLNVTWNF